MENKKPESPVRQFNGWLANVRNCDGCPMRGRGTFVGVDTASGQMAPQSVLFLGLNPGNEEARQGLPFVGPSGRFLRQHLNRAGIHSWGMANSLLCSSANESAIVGADQARSCCRGNLAKIFRVFQSHIIVPCGNGAWSIFRAHMPITKAAENFFVSRGPSGQSAPTLVAPIFHPSALIRSGSESSTKFPGFFARLQLIGQLANIHAAGGDCLEYLRHKNMNILPCFTDTKRKAEE